MADVLDTTGMWDATASLPTLSETDVTTAGTMLVFVTVTEKVTSLPTAVVVSSSLKVASPLASLVLSTSPVIGTRQPLSNQACPSDVQFSPSKWPPG